MTAAPAASPAPAITTFEARLMRLAIALGGRHLGLTWPNPSVGALVVAERGGEAPVILAEGITQRGGRPHAERVALEAAGAAARGATLYISLEPCSHHGQTPPCVDAVIAAGIARVVTPFDDPDPRVSGRGHARLRQAGIEVTTGVLAAEAACSHRGHFIRSRFGRPAVTVKLAATADHYVGRSGGRLRITGAGADARVHLMRAHADAVLVGIGTVLADDPRLDVRLPGLEERSPGRIVIDSRLRLPLSAGLVATAKRLPTWVIARADADPRRIEALADRGVEVITVAPDPAGAGVDLAAALVRLGAVGLTQVLCEAGPTLAAALLAAGLVDEAVLITSDRRLDGPGVPLTDAIRAMIAARFRRVRTERVGADEIAYFEAF